MTEQSLKIFEYNSLNASKNEMIHQFHEQGFIAVNNVPNFAQAYKNFIQSSQDFIALSPEEKIKYQPDDYYTRGWSYGVETFDDVRDSYKGSYYAYYPNDAENIWPDLPDFKENYLALSKIIVQTGKEILPLLGLNLDELLTIARMLFYSPLDQKKDDGSANWCGLHKDHGLLTGLCPAVYYKNNEVVQKPKDCGLFINGKEISVSPDILLFQTGESAELLTNGKVTATEHFVRKAYGGYERYAFALFFNCDKNHQIDSTVTKYNDRFRPGMTSGEWLETSLKKHN